MLPDDTMRSDGIVIVHPLGQSFASANERCEECFVEQLIMQPAIEALDEVLQRGSTTWRDRSESPDRRYSIAMAQPTRHRDTRPENLPSGDPRFGTRASPWRKISVAGQNCRIRFIQRETVRF